MALAVAVFAAGMAAGPSGLVASWGHDGPFLARTGHLSRGTVTLIARMAALCAGTGAVAVLVALRRGWTGVPPRALVVAGAAVAALMAVLPPAGSIDILNYAEYGRIAALGHDPYSMTPEQLRHTGDPVGLLRPRAWRDQPTVYGPVATLVQAVAARLGGASMGWILFWIKVVHAAAFVAAGVVLDRLAGPGRGARIRAAALWTANPLMLFWMVGSGHADVLAVALLAGAVLVLRRDARWQAGLAAGVLAGCAVSVKVTFAVPVLGLALGCLRRPRVLAAGAAGAAGAVGVAYLIAGRSAVSSLSQRMSHKGDLFLPVPSAVLDRPALYSACILVTTVAAALLLWWRLGMGGTAPGELDLRPAAAFGLACVLVSPVQYPWYDAAFLPLLALIPATRFDEVLVARTVTLTCVLLPGIGTALSQYDTARSAVLVFSAVFAVLLVLPHGRRAGDGGAVPAPPLVRRG